MNTKSPERCQHIPIAHSSAGQVAICAECQVVHVELGHVSLRFTPDTFREIGHMFASAQARLERASEASSAPVAKPVGSGGPSLH